jgi:ferric hydroxamate transport system ATP-binding protein
MTPLFEIRNLTIELGSRATSRRVIENLDLDIPAGRTVALIGHNGSGKSTLLKALARQIGRTSGEVVTMGRPQDAWSARDHARALAYLPQYTPAAEGMTVRQLVALGRYPWHGALGRPTATDREAVEAAIIECGLSDYESRLVDTLSGGERQRAWLAMLLAQGAKALLLDEPISALDIAHQIEVMSLVHRLSEAGRSVVVVLHDVNLAARFADHIIALKSGKVVLNGTSEDLMQPDALSRVYGLAMDVVTRPGRSPLASAL